MPGVFSRVANGPKIKDIPKSRISTSYQSGTSKLIQLRQENVKAFFHTWKESNTLWWGHQTRVTLSIPSWLRMSPGWDLWAEILRKHLQESHISSQPSTTPHLTMWKQLWRRIHWPTSWHTWMPPDRAVALQEHRITIKKKISAKIYRHKVAERLGVWINCCRKRNNCRTKYDSFELRSWNQQRILWRQDKKKGILALLVKQYERLRGINSGGCSGKAWRRRQSKPMGLLWYAMLSILWADIQYLTRQHWTIIHKCCTTPYTQNDTWYI